MTFLSIVIPSFGGELRVLKTLSMLEAKGFLVQKDIHVAVVENPSPKSNLSFSIKRYSSVAYYQNHEQIGLHGSWIRAVEIMSHAKWLLIMGDDDCISNNSQDLLDRLRVHCSNGASYIIAQTLSPVPDLMHAHISTYLDSVDYLRYSDLNYGFGFLSNVFFRPSEALISIAQSINSSLEGTDCLHYLTHLIYSVSHSAKIQLDTSLSIDCSIYIDEDFRTDNELIASYSLQIGLICSRYPSFIIWLNTFDFLLAWSKMLTIHNKLRLICAKQLRSSFRLWIRSSRFNGFFTILKMIIISPIDSRYLRVLLFLTLPQ